MCRHRDLMAGSLNTGVVAPANGGESKSPASRSAPSSSNASCISAAAYFPPSAAMISPASCAPASISRHISQASSSSSCREPLSTSSTKSVSSNFPACIMYTSLIDPKNMSVAMARTACVNVWQKNSMPAHGWRSAGRHRFRFGYLALSHFWLATVQEVLQAD